MTSIRLSFRTPMSIVINGKWSAATIGLSLETYGVDVTRDELIVYGTDNQCWHFPRSEVLCYVAVGFTPNRLDSELNSELDSEHEQQEEL